MPAAKAIPIIILALALAGCEKPPPSPVKTDTGADAVAKSFCEALLHEDWPAAYPMLDIESRAHCSPEQFASLGRSHREMIGFNPTEVSVMVTENGEQASAIVSFRAGAKSFRDGLTLRKGPGGWAVALRANFGRKAP